MEDSYSAVSLCKVLPPNIKGEHFLERLADFDVDNHLLNRFVYDENRKYEPDNTRRIVPKGISVKCGEFGVFFWESTYNKNNNKGLPYTKKNIGKCGCIANRNYY